MVVQKSPRRKIKKQAEKKGTSVSGRLVLIDGNAIVHRAFHALPPLTAPSGELTNAVYGFTTILLRIFRELKPDYIAAAFDTPKPTFRHAAYARYKAQRAKAPDELYAQFPRTKEVLAAFDIPVFEKEGFEADDIIGTFVKKFRREYPKVAITIVTGDMDTLQLVDEKTKVWTMRKGVSDTVLYDADAVRSRFGIGPEAMIDYKGLRGDPSDNIPGVKGVGEKTASELLMRFGSLDALYKELLKTKDISPSLRGKLIAGKEDAFFSRDLATIRTDVPVAADIALLAAHASGGETRHAAVAKLFRELGFFSLLKRLYEKNEEGAKKAAIPERQDTKTQGTLLGAPEATPIKTALCEQGILLDDIWKDIRPATAFASFFKKHAEEETALQFLSERGELVVLFPSGEHFGIRQKNFSQPALKYYLSSSARKYIFDAKPLYTACLKKGVLLNGVFDFLIAAHLFHPEESEYDIRGLIGRELPSEEESADLPATLQRYFPLGIAVEQHLLADGLMRVFSEIELPLTPVLAEMEQKGIRFDAGYIKKLSQKISADVAALAQDIYHDAGEEFNISSPPQVSRILFEKLGIAAKGVRKTGGGKISTKFSELSKLAVLHPIVPKILQYRELAKLQTTYVDPLPALVGADGRLHTTFNQTGTQTGRLASENPNLQNIPVKTEYGREVRKAFVPEPGWLLYSFDYSQVELRVAADLSGDEKMLRAFRDGLDIHALTASEVNNIPLEKVTPELRRKAKALNFGVLYGMGAKGFSESAHIPLAEAEQFIEEYFDDFKGVAAYIEKTKQFARDNGFVATAYGRRRPLPGIHSSNFMIQREAERMAVNMPIQGTATGDIMKLAMIRVAALIRERFSNDARPLLQIHDELLCEIREDGDARIARDIQETMEEVWRGRVRLKVDVKRGKNWAELENHEA